MVITTPSHGGIWITPGALARLDPALQETRTSKDGWYEDQYDWCIAYLALDLAGREPDPIIGRAQATLARYVLDKFHPNLVAIIERLRQSEDDDA